MTRRPLLTASATGLRVAGRTGVQVCGSKLGGQGLMGARQGMGRTILHSMTFFRCFFLFAMFCLVRMTGAEYSTVGALCDGTQSHGLRVVGAARRGLAGLSIMLCGHVNDGCWFRLDKSENNGATRLGSGGEGTGTMAVCICSRLVLMREMAGLRRGEGRHLDLWKLRRHFGGLKNGAAWARRGVCHIRGIFRRVSRPELVLCCGDAGPADPGGWRLCWWCEEKGAMGCVSDTWLAGSGDWHLYCLF